MRKSSSRVNIILAFFIILDGITALSFVLTSCRNNLLHSPVRMKSKLFSVSEDEEQLLDGLKKMRVKEIKEELKAFRLRTNDVFEKDALIMRLFEAKKAKKNESKPRNSSTESPSKKNNKKNNNNSDDIRIPLEFISLEDMKPIQTRDSRGSVSLTPMAGKFPVITMEIPSSKAKDSKMLTMMVDTACSGFVLRPSVVQKHGLPMYGGDGVSMTTAGGTASGTGLSQVNNLKLVDGSEFASFPVAVQDVGALPEQLDGIVGLSFLSQFNSIIFDFPRSELILNKKLENEMSPSTLEKANIELITDAEMKFCRLGIWAANVVLDGRGPVKMLVDTGATSTYLNWNGVEDMNLSRDHPLVSRNSNPIGALGGNDQVLSLSHRFTLKRRFKLDGMSTDTFSTGLELTESDEVNIDIGDLPVLQAIQSEGINGILGSDLLFRCDLLRLNLSRTLPSVSLLEKKGDKTAPYPSSV